MRLTVICNMSRWTIFVSGGFWVFQMVLESDIGRCASENVNSKEGWLWDPTSVGEGNETFLIKVWKSLSSRYVLKLWGWRRYVTGQNRQYLLAVGLGYYKWYQSLTPDGVLVRTLTPRRVDDKIPHWGCQNISLVDVF